MKENETLARNTVCVCLQKPTKGPICSQQSLICLQKSTAIRGILSPSSHCSFTSATDPYISTNESSMSAIRFVDLDLETLDDDSSLEAPCKGMLCLVIVFSLSTSYFALRGDASRSNPLTVNYPRNIHMHRECVLLCF